MLFNILSTPIQFVHGRSNMTYSMRLLFGIQRDLLNSFNCTVNRTGDALKGIEEAQEIFALDRD